MTTVPLYTIQLKQRILKGLVTIGKYDGSHSCLTAATTGDKVIVHSPHLKERALSVLNMNQGITSICAGKLMPEDDRDVLVVGTKTTVLAYHVENNTDLFYKEIADGANAMVIGKLGKMEKPLVFVGGNCSIQGFDWEGNVPFWTVTGDNVRSIALLDIDSDDENELVVGSDDYEIRIFKGDSLITEITETETITSLIPLQDNIFAYSLANGTIGIYERYNRIWRVKSKNGAECVCSFDLTGDGRYEVLTGWSNGKVDGRNSGTGDVVFRDSLPHAIAGLVVGDYTMTGKTQLIAITTMGEVRGYDSTSVPKTNLQQGDLIRDLMTRKQALQAELRNYTAESIATGIPSNTRLLTEIHVTKGSGNDKGCVEVSLSISNMSVIRGATVFAEGIFQGEALVILPPLEEVSTTLTIPLCPPKDTPLDIHIRAFVGNRTSKQQFHVFEVTRQLPRFSMYLVTQAANKSIPDSYVNFKFTESPQRLDNWQNMNFLVSSNMEERGGEGPSGAVWSLNITSLRDGAQATLTAAATTMTIATKSMALAADLVQSLAANFNIEHLQSFAEFPGVFAEIQDGLIKVEELRQNSTRMTASMADTANLARSLIVQAEDSRLLMHMYKNI